eukprot:TRINITY_DN4975_c0_g1_i9.p2 TRINITY_DN4975_c0_g1~~TRINITY_DN4975_c0_g1_i9.p2  ORF type:complete len:210 (+),score=-17.43 TRINITY_DN4975_c0_g1_i9:241-870(+)
MGLISAEESFLQQVFEMPQQVSKSCRFFQSYRKVARKKSVEILFILMSYFYVLSAMPLISYLSPQIWQLSAVFYCTYTQGTLVLKKQRRVQSLTQLQFVIVRSLPEFRVCSFPTSRFPIQIIVLQLSVFFYFLAFLNYLLQTHVTKIIQKIRQQTVLFIVMQKCLEICSTLRYYQFNLIKSVQRLKQNTEVLGNQGLQNFLIGQYKLKT